MKDITQSRLASGLTIAVGLWLLLSPRFISISGSAFANILVAGSVITIAGFLQLVWENTIPSWVVGFVAMWLFVASLAFGMGAVAVWNEALAALVCLVLAAWDGIEIEQAHRQHHAGV